MPTIPSKYRPPLLFRNSHLNTIYPNITPAGKVDYERITLSTPDGDFIDLDFTKKKSTKIVLLLHGLEGSAQSRYIRRFSRRLNKQGYVTVAMNQRGCSGRPNRLISSYHSGKTDDLEQVLDYLSRDFEAIYLAGFSLGGNIVLKFLGEKGRSLPHQLKKAAAVSVPVDLAAAGDYMERPGSRFYMKRLVRALVQKVEQKLQLFPAMQIKPEDLKGIESFKGFDDLFTAPVHGFKNAADYYQRSSSKQFLPDIQLPTLLLNAKDDPFLSPECYPFEEAGKNEYLQFETPKYGGHVGFVQDYFLRRPRYFEERIISFFE